MEVLEKFSGLAELNKNGNLGSNVNARSDDIGGSGAGINHAPEERKYPVVVEGRTLRGIPGMSVAEWFREEGRAEAFLTWHGNTLSGREPNRTSRGYMHALLNMDDIYHPDDWKGRRVTATEKNAFRLFLKYFNSLYYTNMHFNGYSQDDWKTGRAESKTNEGAKSDTVVKDGTLKEAYSHFMKIEDRACQVFYTLLCYSGARIQQLFDLYEGVARGVPLKIDWYKDCFRVDVHHLSHNTKDATYYYFPLELKNAVLNYRNPYTYAGTSRRCGAKVPVTEVHTYVTDDKEVLDGINEGLYETVAELNASTEGLMRPIYPKTLRKVFVNWMMLAGMDRQVANAISARQDESVSDANYISNANIHARKQYPKAVQLFLNQYPIPEWMQEYEGNEPRKISQKELMEQGDADILRMIRAKKSTAEIKKALGTSTVRIARVAREHNIDRSSQKGRKPSSKKKQQKSK